MVLIYTEDGFWESRSDAEREALTQEYFGLTRDMRDAGVYLSGAPLRPASEAVVIRARGGAPLHTDGPFAETKEQLGGYMLLDVDSIEDALAWAERIPAVRYGSVEVRPVTPVSVPA